MVELDASGSYPHFEIEVADGWYDRAHAAIVEGFISLIDPDIQKKYWIPK